MVLYHKVRRYILYYHLFPLVANKHLKRLACLLVGLEILEQNAHQIRLFRTIFPPCFLPITLSDYPPLHDLSQYSRPPNCCLSFEPLSQRFGLSQQFQALRQQIDLSPSCRQLFLEDWIVGLADVITIVSCFRAKLPLPQGKDSKNSIKYPKSVLYPDCLPSPVSTTEIRSILLLIANYQGVLWPDIDPLDCIILCLCPRKSPVGECLIS